MSSAESLCLEMRGRVQTFDIEFSLGRIEHLSRRPQSATTAIRKPQARVLASTLNSRAIHHSCIYMHHAWEKTVGRILQIQRGAGISRRNSTSLLAPAWSETPARHSKRVQRGNRRRYACSYNFSADTAAATAPPLMHRKRLMMNSN
jgi:hypothetical protein